MNIFFIEESNKIKFFKGLFRNVELNENKIIINTKLKKAKMRKKIKIVKNIKSLLNKFNSNFVVISKDLKKDKDFLNLIYSYNIEIIDGRKLFKMYILEIVEIISKNLGKEQRECKIALLSNEFNRFVDRVIKELAVKCKYLNIVTYNLENFEKLEEDLRQDGVIISVSNNKRKSLRNVDIILNLDFLEEVINLYNIYENAIIVNFENNLKIYKKRFSGRIINWYELRLDDNSKLWNKIKKEYIERYYFNELMEFFYYMGELNFEETSIAFLPNL